MYCQGIPLSMPSDQRTLGTLTRWYGVGNICDTEIMNLALIRKYGLELWVGEQDGMF